MQAATDGGRTQTKFHLQSRFFWIIWCHQLLLVLLHCPRDRAWSHRAAVPPASRLDSVLGTSPGVQYEERNCVFLCPAEQWLVGLSLAAQGFS